MLLLTWSSTFVAAMIALMFVSNLGFFRTASRCLGTRIRSKPEADSFPEISVLIPARNEARRIGSLLDSVLASSSVNCEVCVLDDESTDATAEIVLSYGKNYPNVRLVRGTAKPAGWSGKQYACYQLARQATYEELVFLDADVSLAPECLSQAVMLRRQLRAELLSGFPRQQVVSPGEQLLIPLIHLVLLCFLPFVLMKFTRMKAAAAGCGQFFLTTKQAYEKTGGHSMIRQSLHDGIMLPRAYRSHGLKTDLFDASDIASCRMYSSFEDTWNGLLKNAHEGFANMPLLPVMTIVMYLGFIHPLIVLAGIVSGILGGEHIIPGLIGASLSILPRGICCIRFDRALPGVLLNPVSICLFLLIQWTAWIRRIRGREIQWRSRSYEIAAS